MRTREELHVVRFQFFSEKENLTDEACTIFEAISIQNKYKFFGYQTKCEHFMGFSYLNST